MSSSEFANYAATSSMPNLTALQDELLRSIDATRTDFRKVPFDSVEIEGRMEDLGVNLIRSILAHSENSEALLQRITEEQSKS